jgi:hypothetical protein
MDEDTQVGFKIPTTEDLQRDPDERGRLRRLGEPNPGDDDFWRWLIPTDFENRPLPVKIIIYAMTGAFSFLVLGAAVALVLVFLGLDL